MTLKTAPKTADLVLIGFRHVEDEGANPIVDDRIVISVVHKPLIENDRHGRLHVRGYAAACGSNLESTPTQVVDRRNLNMRSVRKCQQRACFGGPR